MQLNEIIEENTLQSISAKTRLSVENLEKLFAQNFGEFRKVQALGFISILEREYRADLSEIRAACRAYFSGTGTEEMPEESTESLPDVPRQPSPIVDTGAPGQSSSLIKYFVVGVVAIGLLYAAWQTYASGMQESNASRSGEDVGFFSSIIKQATGWIGGKDGSSAGTFDVNVSQGNTSAQEEKEASTDETFVAEKVSDPEPKETPKSSEEKEEDIIKKVQQEQAKKLKASSTKVTEEEMAKIDNAIATAPEENTTDVVPLSTEVPSVAQGTQTSTEAPKVTSDPSPTFEELAAKKKAAQEAARLQAEKEAAQLKAAEEKALQEREARQKAAKERAAKAKAAKERAAKEKAAKEKAAKERAAKAKAAKAKMVVLKPRKKIWLGIVNLTEMKRRVATSRATQTFDTAKGKWIVATGHGFIDYDEGLEKKKFNDGKKHFLMISNGKVKEISHEEFQRLNKSKVW